MNPTTPMSYYQQGVVTVTKGSHQVTGLHTDWVRSDNPAKPVIGSVLTLDNASFYFVKRILDDTTMELTKPYLEPSQIESSYLLINQLDMDLSDDDKLTLTGLIEDMAAAVQQAKDWAIKTDGAVEDDEWSSKWHASRSAASAVIARDGARLAMAQAAAARESEQSAAADKDAVTELAAEVAANTVTVESDAADVAAAHDAVAGAVIQVTADAEQVALDAAQTQDSAQLAHDFAVGPNPPATLESPSDSNNSYYYFSQVLGLTSGAVAFGNVFTPSAGTEYPEAPATSTMWLIQTTDADGYTFTTGNMATVTVKTGDWLVYYAALGGYEALRVSPLHQAHIIEATDVAAGIVRLATAAEAATDLNTAAVTPYTLNLMLNALVAQLVTDGTLVLSSKAIPPAVSSDVAGSGFGGLRYTLDGTQLHLFTS